MIETWAFGVREAARVAGFEEGSLVNLLSRHKPFPHRQGRAGTPLVFIMPDLLTLSAIRGLLNAGFSQVAATNLANSGVDLYSKLKEGSPNTILLRMPKGKIGTSDYQTSTSAVMAAVDPWYLFDELYPTFKAILLEQEWLVPRADRESALADYENHMAARRRMTPAESIVRG